MVKFKEFYVVYFKGKNLRSFPYRRSNVEFVNLTIHGNVIMAGEGLAGNLLAFEKYDFIKNFNENQRHISSIFTRVITPDFFSFAFIKLSLFLEINFFMSKM